MVTLALLQIKNFSFSYPRSAQPALQGINISVEKGEFIGITGPTGAGKSTLTYCLNGIIPHFQGEAARAGSAWGEHPSSTGAPPRSRVWWAASSRTRKHR